MKKCLSLHPFSISDASLYLSSQFCLDRYVKKEVRSIVRSYLLCSVFSLSFFLFCFFITIVTSIERAKI